MQQQQMQARLERHKEREKLFLVGLEHIDGLPLSDKAPCSIFYNQEMGNNRLEISGGGKDFRLGIDKIADITMQTDVEIPKAYVSSIGGAAAGNMIGGALFGNLGAKVGVIIGGRAKPKENTKTEYYLIITYDKDNQTSYVSFKVNASQYGKVDRFANMISAQLSHKSRTLK